MFTPLSRLILLLLCALLSLAGAYFGIWPVLIFTFIASVGLLWGYYKAGSVLLSLSRFRKNEFPEAEKMLDYIQRPELLSKANQANYYFISGFLAREKDMFREAKPFLQRALEIGLKNQNDRAMTLLALADMELMTKQEAEAKKYFLQMKGLKVHKSLMPEIRKMQEWLDV
jgi:hypothetical protein